MLEHRAAEPAEPGRPQFVAARTLQRERVLPVLAPALGREVAFMLHFIATMKRTGARGHTRGPVEPMHVGATARRTAAARSPATKTPAAFEGHIFVRHYIYNIVTHKSST